MGNELFAKVCGFAPEAIFSILGQMAPHLFPVILGAILLALTGCERSAHEASPQELPGKSGVRAVPEAKPLPVPLGHERLSLGRVDHDCPWNPTDAQLAACLADAGADPELSKYGELIPKPQCALAGDERCVIVFEFTAATDLSVIYYFLPSAAKPESKCLGSAQN